MLQEASYFKVYLALMFLLDMCEESRIAEIPLTTRASEFPLSFLFPFYDRFVVWRILFAHKL